MKATLGTLSQEVGDSMDLFDGRYCMERLCRACPRKEECDILEYTKEWRLTYKPFEHLKDHKLCRAYGKGEETHGDCS